MRCKCMWTLILSTAVLTVLSSALAATDDVGQSSEPSTSEVIQVKQSADVDAKAPDADEDTAPDVSTKAKTGIPTRAKRKPGDTVSTAELSETVSSTKDVAAEQRIRRESISSGAAPITIVPIDEPAAEPSPKPEQDAEQPEAQTADEPLRPIPDSMGTGLVAVEAASFSGITPGVSTRQDVKKAWGQPKEMAGQDDSLMELYSVEPFDRIEVTYAQDKVSSVVIRFDRAFPAENVAKQLDLATIRPVLVANELGEVLGLAYPERGVLFAFEASSEPGKPSMKVAQIVLEPISAEPFVLRAETTLETRCDLSCRDLEQALSLEPDNARAHWLHGRALVAMEQHEKAAGAVAKAVHLDPDNPHYRATLAQILAELGRLSEAIEESQKAVETSESRPHVKARALCLIGDLLASGPKPDYKKAITFHTQALQIADPLTSDPHPAIRIAAKEVLIDAHLGAAHDIAWGDWKEKNKAVARWLERAVAVAEDLVNTENSGGEQLFRAHVRAMAAYVGLRGGVDPKLSVEAVISAGDKLIAATRDPAHKAQLQWDLGMALYDAVQIFQMRSEYDDALKYGQQAAEYLATAKQIGQSASSDYLLGRLYFRLGTIHALGNQDHRAATDWFDKAIPLLERQLPEELAADLGRQGEAFVSMGVSYWNTDQRQKALGLTEKGIQWMEQAVERGTLDRPTLAVPYSNLAAMHRKLGDDDHAERFQKMATRLKNEKLK